MPKANNNTCIFLVFTIKIFSFIVIMVALKTVLKLTGFFLKILVIIAKSLVIGLLNTTFQIL